MNIYKQSIIAVVAGGALTATHLFMYKLGQQHGIENNDSGINIHAESPMDNSVKLNQLNKQTKEIKYKLTLNNSVNYVESSPEYKLISVIQSERTKNADQNNRCLLAGVAELAAKVDQGQNIRGCHVVPANTYEYSVVSEFLALNNLQTTVPVIKPFPKYYQIQTLVDELLQGKVKTITILGTMDTKFLTNELELYFSKIASYKVEVITIQNKLDLGIYTRSITDGVVIQLTDYSIYSSTDVMMKFSKSMTKNNVPTINLDPKSVEYGGLIELSKPLHSLVDEVFNYPQTTSNYKITYSLNFTNKYGYTDRINNLKIKQ